MTKEVREFCFRLAGAAILMQFGNHGLRLLSSGNPHWVMPHLIAWLHDGIILLVLFHLSRLWFWGMETFHSSRYFAFLILSWWAPGLFFLAIYPRFIPDFLTFPVNILLVESGVVRFFFQECVPWKDLLLSFVSLGLTTFLLQRIAAKPTFAVPRVAKIIGLLIFCITFGHPSPNPIVYGIQDTLMKQIVGRPRAVPLLQIPPRKNVSGEQMKTVPPEVFSCEGLEKWLHILVIVMETVEGARFEKEILNNPDSFLGRHRQEFRYFSQYFSPNLDSFTSLLAMLTRISAPYPAYADPDRYAGIQKAENLIRAFRQEQRHTVFVCTAQHQPFVPVRQDWDQILTLADLNPDPQMISIETPRIEAAVEDRAAHPMLMLTLKSHPKTFLLQECVFGHSQAWSDRAGVSQLEYYDRYIAELMDDLQKNGLRETTLLVLLADHGSREDPAVAAHYRVPFLLWGAGVQPGIDRRFLSHKDFSRLLQEPNSDKRPFPLSPPLRVVGHSGQWVYGEIAENGDCGFLENSRGTILHAQGSFSPAEVHSRFQKELYRFTDDVPDARHAP